MTVEYFKKTRLFHDELAFSFVASMSSRGIILYSDIKTVRRRFMLNFKPALKYPPLYRIEKCNIGSFRSIF
jgi:hypothetical protein